MNEVIVENTMPEIKTWNGRRVVTLKDIDIAHGRALGTAKRNFNKNKKHFVHGEDYIVRNSYEARNEYNMAAPKGLTLLTETGYLMIVKSFTDDLSWEVQRRLVNSYFKATETTSTPAAIPTCALAKNKQKTWSEKNLWKFQKICKDMDWELKYLYHKILLELNDMYNMDFYKNDYHNKHHTPPKYNMDLINEYFELQQMADKYLEYLMNTFGETLV